MKLKPIRIVHVNDGRGNYYFTVVVDSLICSTLGEMNHKLFAYGYKIGRIIGG